MLAYPAIDPVAVSLGPVRLHWYGLMYVIAFLLAWLKRKDRAEQDPSIRPAVLREALEQAAEFSSKTCLVYGAFGEGTAFEPMGKGEA